MQPISSHRIRIYAGLATVMMLLASITQPIHVFASSPVAMISASTFTVNSQADAVAAAPLDNGVCETAPGNHTCTLRAAIMKANHFPGGNVTIVLPAGAYDITIPPTGSDDETNGDLNLSASQSLIGAGASTSVIDAHQVDRVLNVGAGSTVTISGVSWMHGKVSDVGGGLINHGSLTLTDDVVSGNQTTGGSAGGGIANLSPGILTMNNVIINDNRTDGNAGGAFNDSGSQLTINNSTIRNNLTTNGGYGGGLGNSGTLTLYRATISQNIAAGKGGGIANFSGILTAMNSTISNNSAILDGGGIYNTDTVNAYFTTIVGNLADSQATGAGKGGGIYAFTTVGLKASLLADNFVATAPEDGYGPVNSLDYNLIQTVSNFTLTGITSHNILGNDANIDEARMNGGLTPTRALFSGSQALDAVPSPQCTDSFGAPLTTDQRGFIRPVNGACDIGAYEGQQAVTGYFRNLVRNGDAEASAGSPNGAFVGIPSWQTSGQLMTAVPYNSAGGFPSLLTDLVPTSHGDNFFAGGISSGAGGMQTVDLSPLAASIDTGGLNYDFSADLGGYLNQNDSATVEADFLDGNTHLLSQVILGPVTAADRGNQTGLLHRGSAGTIPGNTRQVALFINMAATNGPYNDGYVDNVSLVIPPAGVIFLPLVTH